MAVQHKILTAIWHMLTHDVAYHDLGPDYFDHKPRSPQHQAQRARRQAQRARRLIAELIEQGYDVSQLIPEHAA